MKLETKILENTLYVQLEGELDHNSALTIRDKFDLAVNKNGYNKVILDLSRLSFMDSTGVGLIMGRYKRLRDRNINIYLTESNQQIDKVLKVSGIYKIIPKI